MTSSDSPVGLDLEPLDAQVAVLRSPYSYPDKREAAARWLIDASPRLIAEVRRLQVGNGDLVGALRTVRAIGARSGVNVNAWNDAFFEIDRALAAGGVS